MPWEAFSCLISRRLLPFRDRHLTEIPCLLQLPTEPKPRANEKTESKSRAITLFELKSRESKKTELKLRATTLFKRPAKIPGGPLGDPRARASMKKNQIKRAFQFF